MKELKPYMLFEILASNYYSSHSFLNSESMHILQKKGLFGYKDVTKGERESRIVKLLASEIEFCKKNGIPFQETVSSRYIDYGVGFRYDRVTKTINIDINGEQSQQIMHNMCKNSFDDSIQRYINLGKEEYKRMKSSKAAQTLVEMLFQNFFIDCQNNMSNEWFYSHPEAPNSFRYFTFFEVDQSFCKTSTYGGFRYSELGYEDLKTEEQCYGLTAVILERLYKSIKSEPYIFDVLVENSLRNGPIELLYVYKRDPISSPVLQKW